MGELQNVQFGTKELQIRNVSHLSQTSFVVQYIHHLLVLLQGTVPAALQAKFLQGEEPADEDAEELDPATVAQRSEKVLTAFRRNMKSLGLWDRITVHKSDSYAATAAFRDASLGLCFIDADHTFEGVTRDLESWWPKICPGGILSGHDYSGSRKYSVVPAVNAFADAAGLTLEHGRAKRRSQRHVCWAIRKPG